MQVNVFTDNIFLQAILEKDAYSVMYPDREKCFKHVQMY